MPSRTVPYLIAAAVFLFDRLSKDLVKANVTPWDSHHIIPGFLNLVHAENPGVAFGLLADSTGIWRNIFLIGLSATVMVFIAGMLWKPTEGLLLRTGLALVLGGAMGNLFDRIVHGTVTDFVEVYVGTHFFPAFNVADSAISVGAGFMLLDMWQTRHKKLEQNSVDVS